MPELVFVESVASGHGPVALQVAKACGYAIAFFTENPDFYKAWDIPNPLSLVDRLVVTDTASADAMFHHAAAGDVRGIIALDDFHLLPASQLAERLSLPHQTLTSLRMTRYKHLTRERLSRDGVHTPRWFTFGEADTPEDSPVGYPCVLKPTDGTASVDVFICADQRELQSALMFVKSQSRIVRGYTFDRQWLLEEYIDGPEYSAELLCSDGKWHLVGVTKKLISRPPYCVEVGHVFPATLPAAVVDAIRADIFHWLGLVGLDFGAAHVEFKLLGGRPILMEINPRLGGDMIPELIRLSTSFDPLRHLILQHTSDPRGFVLPDFYPHAAAAIRFVIPEHSGRILKVQGARLEGLEFVKRSILRQEPLLSSGLKSSYDRLGYVITTGRDPAEAELNATEAIEHVDVIFEE